MSKVHIVSGRQQDDHLALVVNSNDEYVNISIDYLSGTEDFVRASCELSQAQQIALCLLLKNNIMKWK